MQHTSELRTKGRHITPRHAFLTDLSDLLQRFRRDNQCIILCGNFNEAITPTNDGMTKLMSDFHLVNLTYHLIGHDNFTTYHRGATRVDTFYVIHIQPLLSLQGVINPSSTGSRYITDPSPSTFTFQHYLEMTTTVYKLLQ